MELFHTSPELIAKISAFGSFLCFSGHIYITTGGDEVFTYKLEQDESQLIRAGSLFYHEEASKLEGVVAQVAKKFGCDSDTAEELLSERADEWPLIE